MNRLIHCMYCVNDYGLSTLESNLNNVKYIPFPFHALVMVQRLSVAFSALELTVF